MPEKIRSYRELVVWQRAMELVKQVYGLVKKFPREETYALGDQIRRAVVSVPSNIAEGQARRHSGEFRHFLHVALGSLDELDTQHLIAADLGYLKQTEMAECEAGMTVLRKMLGSLIVKLPSGH